MEQSIFERLLASATSQSDYSEHEISFLGRIGEYGIHFYSVAPFKVLRTYEFGHAFKGEWIEDKPTPYQVEQMMQHIQLEVADYYKWQDRKKTEKENHNHERPYIDKYKHIGDKWMDIMLNIKNIDK